jgi:3-isopropylmalate dehydrogenase
MILSVQMLLGWLAERRGSDALAKASQAIEKAVDTVLEDPAALTADLGGTLGCKPFGERVVRAL